MRMTRTATLMAALLAVPSAPLLAQTAEGTTPLFTVNFGTTVWTALVFLLLLAILGRFAWGPVLAAADLREKKIQAAIDEAARQNAEAVKLLEEHRARMAEAHREAHELLAEGKAAGEKLRGEIEEKAREDAQTIVERARREIERERDQALDVLRRESVELALAAASRLMRENLDSAKDRELVEQSLAELRQSRGAEA